MKKLLVLFLGLSLFLAACGGGEESEEASGDATEEPVAEEISAETEETTEPEAEESNSEVKEGDTIENEMGTFNIVSKQTDLSDSYENGPINLTITGTQLGTLEPSEDFKDMFEGKDKLTTVTVGMEVENTSEDTIAIYPNQSILTTDAGDQVNSDVWLSDDVGGDFHGQVTKDGEVIFLLDTPAEEISSGELIIDGSHTVEDYETVGEQMEIELKF